MSRQDIENAEKTWVEAFNAGDAAGVVGCYTKDARLLPPNSDIVQGAKALTPFLQGFIDTGAKMVFDLLDVHATHDICAAVGKYEMTFPNGDRDKGKFLEVWARQKDGSWLIAEDCFNSSLPAAVG